MAEVVSINSKVTLSCNNIMRTYTLVESKDLDTSATKISCLSPLGKQLISKKVNDILKIKTPDGIIKYKIITIER